MTWYALRSTPRGEFRANEELGLAGIDRFVPFYMVRTLVRHTKGRQKITMQPLMPGYLFADVSFSTRSHDPYLLDRCGHVAGTIRTASGKPIPLREKVVTELVQLCRSGCFDQGRARGHDGRFVNGDKVRITDGTWAGFEVTFRETASGILRPKMGYVAVMFDRLFGTRNFTMHVPQAMLVAA
jgi:transcription antitermination factor NusG